MIINNAINSPFPTTLAKGGTNAALTASNGGIFYSTASAGAILSGTATANQAILSGSLNTPSWSTTTYPATTTINQLLYSSSNNVVAGLATANSACLVSDAEILPITYYPVWSLPMNDGQIIIGGTNGRPEPANLTGGNRIGIVNNPNNITINYLSGMNWQWIDTQTASNSTELNFTDKLLPDYQAYRIILKNILPESDGANMCLRLGYFGGYISDNYYISQQCCISANGVNNFYHGYNGAVIDLVYLTLTNIHAISSDPTYGGLCGTIDLFVTASQYQIGNGISRMSYKVDSVPQYVNTTSTFQITEPFYFSSVQLFTLGYNLVSGSASLYGLTNTV